MTLDELQKGVAEWSQRNFPNNQPYHPLLGVMEEAGELAHAHLKLEQGIRGTPAEHHAAKMDAIGDILIYLADYCGRNKISMQDCMVTAWAEVQKRDWQKHKQAGVQ